MIATFKRILALTVAIVMTLGSLTGISVAFTPSSVFIGNEYYFDGNLYWPSTCECPDFCCDNEPYCHCFGSVDGVTGGTENDYRITVQYFDVHTNELVSVMPIGRFSLRGDQRTSITLEYDFSNSAYGRFSLRLLPWEGITQAGSYHLSEYVMPLGYEAVELLYVIGGDLDHPEIGAVTINRDQIINGHFTGELDIIIVVQQSLSVSVSPNETTVYTGDTVTLRAAASELIRQGALSYQWYVNQSSSNSGGTPISGATGITYSPPTGTASVAYYYCVVTSSDNQGRILASGVSSAAVVRVNNAGESHKKAIIIVPGILGSELWGTQRTGFSKIWFGGDAWLLSEEQLPCDIDGTPLNPNVVALDDGSRGTLETYLDLYNMLTREFGSGGSNNYDVQFFPYDWRLSNIETASKLDSFIEEKEYEEVILVCHSMGGIVASIYIAQYGDSKIDKLITLGTPYLGSPKTLYAFHTGMMMDNLVASIATHLILKAIAPNMPSAYELLPNERYFRNGNYYVETELSPAHELSRTLPTSGGLNYGQTKQFMNLCDVWSHSWYNPGLHSNAEEMWRKRYTYDTLDGVYSRIIRGSIDAHIIVGYNTKTLSCLTISEDASRLGGILGTIGIASFVPLDVNMWGDGTVPIISSTFDFAYLSPNMVNKPYFVDGVSHTGLVEDSNCLRLIANIINGDSYNRRTEGISRSITTEPAFNGYKIIAACPVTLSVYDLENNWIGTVSSDAIECEEGYYYDFYVGGHDNERKYAFVDYECNVVLNGTGSGTMDFTIEKYEDGEVVETISYANIPISADTVIHTNTDMSDNAKLTVVTGNGETIYYASSIANDRMPFTDVLESDWFYNDVRIAYGLGLINGTTATTYSPYNNLSYAEAVKLAACMHQKHMTGSVTLENSNPWYQSFVDYSKENGIIDRDYEWNTPATRADFIEIFAKALPTSALPTINTVPDGAIPDVPSSHLNADAIYRMYRSGIIQGIDSLYRFSPLSNITRSEVSAILTRMMDSNMRVRFSIPG